MKKHAKILVVGVAILMASGWLLSRHYLQRCHEISIEITNDAAEFQLVTKKEIEELLTENSRNDPRGKLFKNININSLEARVQTNKLIKDCQIYRTIGNELQVDITIHIPIARIIKQGTQREFDNYLTAEGVILPMSKNYTIKCVVLEGKIFENIEKQRAEDKEKILGFLQIIKNNDFWNAQISYISIDSLYEVELLTQIGNHRIVFGKLGAYEKKLKKLKYFYQKIIPTIGWEKYKVINISNQNQILCQ